jgi:hypothetical protein
VHLLDGGIADNLALRAATNGVIALDENSDAFRRVALTTRRVLVLSVDGQSAADPALPRERVVTGLGKIFGAVSGTQIDAYNFETLILTDEELRVLVEKIRKVRCAQGRVIAGHDCSDVRGALVHIWLASIPGPRERERLQAIPTGLTIPDEDVDLLVASGERLVQQNAKIRELISNLDGSTRPSQRNGWFRWRDREVSKRDDDRGCRFLPWLRGRRVPGLGGGAVRLANQDVLRTQSGAQPDGGDQRFRYLGEGQSCGAR